MAQTYPASSAQNSGKRGGTGVAGEFELELARYQGLLVQQAFEILGNREDAEDVAQETMVDACRFRDRLSPNEPLIAWLQAANKSNAIDRLRARKRDSKRIEAKKAIHETSFTTGGFSRFELKEALRSAIAALPEDKKKIVNLRYWDHKSYGDIAREMKMPEGTIRRILFDARILLYARLKIQIPSSEAGVNEDSPTANQEPTA